VPSARFWLFSAIARRLGPTFGRAAGKAVGDRKKCFSPTNFSDCMFSLPLSAEMRVIWCFALAGLDNRQSKAGQIARASRLDRLLHFVERLASAAG
jgi:hypothetical protein